MSRKKQVQRMLKLRPAREDDLATLNVYCYNEGMDNLPGVENVTVAVDSDDDPIGFVRVIIGNNDIAHVNPIVVNPYWRGYGVGHILMDDALGRYGELRLVSRGSSLGFYQRIGCTEIGWEDIDMTVTDDCVGCEMHKECCPQPVRLIRK